MTIPQTSISMDQTPARAGKIAYHFGGAAPTVSSRVCGDLGALAALGTPGRMFCKQAADGDQVATLPNDATDIARLQGVLVLDTTKTPGVVARYEDISLLRTGYVHMTCVDALAVGDTVRISYDAATPGQPMLGVTNSAVPTNARISVVEGAGAGAVGLFHVQIG